MAKAYQDIVDEARELLQDTVSTAYRFTDVFLVNRLNNGLQELGRIRPDSMYDLYDAGQLNVPSVVLSGTPTAPDVLITADIQFERQFYNPLVLYVVGSAEIQDDEFTMDNRAGLLLQQFRNTVLGV